MKYSKYFFIVLGSENRVRLLGHTGMASKGIGKEWARKAVVFNTLPKAPGYNSSPKPARGSVW